MHCQEGPSVEPAGEAQHGMRQRPLCKIGSDGEHKRKTYVPLGIKRNDEEEKQNLPNGERDNSHGVKEI